MSARRVAFVCRSLAGEASRCARAIQELDDVTLLTLCVSETDDAGKLIEAAKSFGGLYRIVTAQETLLATVAEANAALGLEAMTPEVVERTLDKSKLKSTLRQVGVATPRDRIINREEDARAFV